MSLTLEEEVIQCCIGRCKVWIHAIGFRKLLEDGKLWSLLLRDAKRVESSSWEEYARTVEEKGVPGHFKCLS